MSYDLDNGEDMGCLADVQYLFEYNDDGVRGLTVDMYSNMPPSSAYLCPSQFRNRDEYHDAVNSENDTRCILKGYIREAAEAFPATIFGSVQDRDEALDTGLIRMTRRTKAAVIHAKLGFFRLFIESPSRLEFYKLAREYDVIGAFIGAHCISPDEIRREMNQSYEEWRLGRGTDQTMFNGLYPSPGFATSMRAVRRVLAMYPRTRKYLIDHYLPDSYVVGDVGQDVWPIFERRMKESDFNTLELYSGKLDIEEATMYFRRWHDTILSIADDIHTSRVMTGVAA